MINVFKVLINNKMLPEIIHKNYFNRNRIWSGKDPLSMHRTESNEAARFSDISSTINDENIITAPGQQEKNSFNFKRRIL